MPNISSMSARYRTSQRLLRPIGRRGSVRQGSELSARIASKPLHSSNPAAFDEAKSPEATPADGF